MSQQVQPPPPPDPPPPAPSEGQQVVYVRLPGNGMAVTSLVLGIVGVVMGLIPLTGFLAIICGVLGLIFGIVGWRKAKAGAGRKGMAIAGTILSALALILGVVGFIIVQDAVTDLDRELNKLNQ